MKIFSWMQSKLIAPKKPNMALANNHMTQSASKEEFSDWPQSLLAIGTFGISNLKADPEREPEESPCQSHPQPPTPEEVGELQEELISFLDTAESGSAEESETPSEPIVCEEPLNKEIRTLQHSVSGVFSRGKDILVDKKNNVIRKKSLTFLLKKIFRSRNRFNHVSLVRDPITDPTLDRSRMEKMLRAILNKKIHPQGSTAKPMPKKYLVSDNEVPEAEDDGEGSIWVKTDSEYIVLEI